MAVKKENKTSDDVFSKEQILGSKKFANRKDILNVLLKDETYSIDDIENIIKEFLNKEVGK